jgi:hypothetical protein
LRNGSDGRDAFDRSQKYAPSLRKVGARLWTVAPTDIAWKDELCIHLVILGVVLDIPKRANFKIASVLSDNAVKRSNGPDSNDQRKRCGITR